MASAVGVAGGRATLDLGSKSSKCVQCGEPDSARITHQPEVGHGGQVDGKHANRGVPGGETRRSCDADLSVLIWSPTWLARHSRRFGESTQVPVLQKFLH